VTFQRRIHLAGIPCFATLWSWRIALWSRCNDRSLAQTTLGGGSTLATTGPPGSACFVVCRRPEDI